MDRTRHTCSGIFVERDRDLDPSPVLRHPPAQKQKEKKIKKKKPDHRIDDLPKDPCSLVNN